MMNSKTIIVFLMVIFLSYTVVTYSYDYNQQDYQKQMEEAQKKVQEQINKQVEETQKRISAEIQESVQEQINRQVEAQKAANADIGKTIQEQVGETQQNLTEAVAQSLSSTNKKENSVGKITLAILVFALLIFIAIKAFSYYQNKKAQKEFATVKGELAVIMFTDMKSFSKHVGKNEQGTLNVAWEYEKIMKGIIPKHGGRVVKTIGDAVMATFKSAVHAINCAKEIQSRLQGKKFKIRIGMHLGEVAHKEGDVFGNNVNIASRIEGKAPPGGVAISEDVYKQVVGKVSYKFKEIGVEQLKNIKEPVKLYKVV